MTLFDWLDNLLGYNFFNYGKKFPVIEKVPDLKFPEPPIKVVVDETDVFIWLQKQIEWETGLRLQFVMDKVNEKFPGLGIVSTRDLSLVDDMGMDSLELTQLLVEAEAHFNIEIPDELAVKVSTIGDALKLICTTIDK